MAESFPNLIAGEWRAASDRGTFEQRNPARLDEVTGRWPAATREDARAAIAAAGEAFPAWAATPARERAGFLQAALAAMRTRRDEIIRIVTLENGKTLDESAIEVDAALREFEFQIHEGQRALGEVAPSSERGVFAYSTRRPLGVVSIIAPWNFPIVVPGRKIAPALMAGNTVVFKPASLTPRTGHLFAEFFEAAGLPTGVFNFLTGGGSTVGHELTTHPAIRAVSFTGSTEVGKKLQQATAPNLVRTQLELGGKNPMVVLEDADLDLAARDAINAAFACAGQWCTSTSRLVVVDSIADALVERVRDLAARYVLGPGEREGVTMGPVCGTDQLETILAAIERGKAEGAELFAGGNRATAGDLAGGCFIEPTLFDRVAPDSFLGQEEVFGPVLTIQRVRDFDHAVEVANGVRYGLASSIYTQDLRRAFEFQARSAVGLTHVNMVTAYKEPQLSFGGIRESGAGHPEAGRTGIEFFTDHQVAYVRYGK